MVFLISMRLLFLNNFIFYCYCFKETGRGGVWNKSHSEIFKAMKVSSPLAWLQELFKCRKLHLAVAKMIFMSRGTSKKLLESFMKKSKWMNHGKCWFSTSQFLSFIQWIQYFPADGADEAGVEDLGQERKRPIMTGGSRALFLQLEQKLEHAVNIVV